MDVVSCQWDPFDGDVRLSDVLNQGCFSRTLIMLPVFLLQAGIVFFIILISDFKPQRMLDLTEFQASM